jgi:hypothetical protein
LVYRKVLVVAPTFAVRNLKGARMYDAGDDEISANPAARMIGPRERERERERGSEI